MYDIIIIGAGPGGYAASIRAAELGMKACLIEKDLVGGACLNRGCIPTKALINSLKLLHDLKKSSELGIDITAHKINTANLFKRKDDVVLRLRQGAEALIRSKGIDLVKGEALFADKNTIKVDSNLLPAKNIIIATGSSPAEKANLSFDHKIILSSDDILKLDYVPKSMAIIGAGAIGCEFASIYNDLGCKVTLIESMDQILPREDKEIARRLEAYLKKTGIDIVKSAKVASIEKGKGAKVNLENQESIEADVVFLCIGRTPNVDGLGLEKIGVSFDEKGIRVDASLKTNIPGIYAIGDATGRFYLAHVAAYEGVVACENIAGKKRAADYSSVPGCVYTHPEIASVGISEDKAKAEGIEVVVAKLPFAALSKTQIMGETDGLIKLISDRKTGKILGVHIFGASASELISNFSIAIANNITIKQMREVIFAHPTLAEAVQELIRNIKD